MTGTTGSMPVCGDGQHVPGELCFALPTSISLGAEFPFGLAAIEVTGDTNMDLLVAAGAGPSVVTMVGDGDGLFSTLEAAVLPLPPVAIAAVDFDGVGTADIAVTMADGKFAVYASNGDGTFAPGYETDLTDQPWGLAAIEGSTGPRLIVAHGVGDYLSFFAPDGAGSVMPGPTIGVGAGPADLATGDLDGDENVDLVVGHGSETSVRALLSDGGAGFRSGSQVFAEKVFAVGLGDLSADGHTDLVFSELLVDRIVVAVGDGAGAFERQPPTDGIDAPRDLKVGDLDLDGNVDVVVVATGSDELVVMIGTGDARLSEALRVPVGGRPQEVVLSDFNGDGLLDLATSNQETDDVTVVLSDP